MAPVDDLEKAHLDINEACAKCPAFYQRVQQAVHQATFDIFAKKRDSGDASYDYITIKNGSKNDDKSSIDDLSEELEKEEKNLCLKDMMNISLSMSRKDVKFQKECKSEVLRVHNPIKEGALKEIDDDASEPLNLQKEIRPAYLSSEDSVKKSSEKEVQDAESVEVEVLENVEQHM